MSKKETEDTSYYRGNSPLSARFVHALRGIGYAWDREPNFRIQLLLALAVLTAMVILPLSGIERAVLIIVVAMVLTLETVNSIFERLLDVIHPKFSEEVKRIKDTMAGVVLIASVASVIVGALILTRPFFRFDTVFQELLFGIRTPAWVEGALIVTQLGGWQLIAALTIFFSVLFGIRRYYAAIGFIIGSVATGGVAVLALKYILERPRPAGTVIVEAAGYSFPSGHVFLATVFWIGIVYILTHRNKQRLYLWVLPAVFIPVVALTRAVLSVHWFSDIASGFLFGIFWILLWYGINKQWFERHESGKS